MASRQHHKLRGAGKEERIGRDQKRIGALRREILDSKHGPKKYFFAKVRRNWQARAAYSAGRNQTRPSKPYGRQKCGSLSSTAAHAKQLAITKSDTRGWS